MKQKDWKPRNSLRVEVSPGLPVCFSDGTRASLVEISLGGCVLETERRLAHHRHHTLEIEYVGAKTNVVLEIYQTYLHELLYKDSGRSYLRYHSRSVFTDTSIEALNVVYRIMADYWSLLEQSIRSDGE